MISIVAFLMGGLMYTLSAQTEQRNFEETRRRLEQARELVLAFAIINGRLPCPAHARRAPAVAGRRPAAAPAPTGVAGWLPARTIGYQQMDSDGYAIDAWGNRIRYAVVATPITRRRRVSPASPRSTPP